MCMHSYILYCAYFHSIMHNKFDCQITVSFLYVAHACLTLRQYIYTCNYNHAIRHRNILGPIYNCSFIYTSNIIFSSCHWIVVVKLCCLYFDPARVTAALEQVGLPRKFTHYQQGYAYSRVGDKTWLSSVSQLQIAFGHRGGKLPTKGPPSGGMGTNLRLPCGVSRAIPTSDSCLELPARSVTFWTRTDGVCGYRAVGRQTRCVNKTWLDEAAGQQLFDHNATIFPTSFHYTL